MNSIYLTGFADEAGPALETQIRVTKELGWKHIEMRNVQVDAGSFVLDAGGVGPTAQPDIDPTGENAAVRSNVHNNALRKLVQTLKIRTFEFTDKASPVSWEI
jgi:hypothetical protein